jgi:hypothetical protein
MSRFKCLKNSLVHAYYNQIALGPMLVLILIILLQKMFYDKYKLFPCTACVLMSQLFLFVLKYGALK